MKTSSCKAKGRDLQKWVRDKIKTFTGLPDDDVRSTSMGAGGEDVQLSSHALELMPLVIECKNLNKISVYKHFEQAENHLKNLSTKTKCSKPLHACVIIKQNRSKPLAVVDADLFLYLMAQRNQE